MERCDNSGSGSICNRESISLSDAKSFLREYLDNVRPVIKKEVRPELMAFIHITDLAINREKFYPLTKENFNDRFDRRSIPRGQ